MAQVNANYTRYNKDMSIKEVEVISINVDAGDLFTKFYS